MEVATITVEITVAKEVVVIDLATLVSLEVIMGKLKIPMK